MHVEAVAWLSARKDVLSTVLLLVSVLTFFRWRTGARRAWVWYGVSLLVFLLASFGMTSQRLARFASKNMALFKLGLTLLFIAMALVIVYNLGWLHLDW